MANYSQVKNVILGRAYDIDGYYGAQCWDGVFYVAEKYLGGKRCHCGITGYVKDIAIQRSTNGILKWCKDVGLKATLKPGDICIWGNCPACPYSHIAFFDHDTNGVCYFLGQNQGGRNGAFNVTPISVSGIIAVFRPNAWDTSSTTTSNPASTTNTPWNTRGIPNGFYKQNATFKVGVDKINVRNAPNTSTSKVVASYSKGQTVVYDCYRADKNGYCWISYISYSGERRYMVCGECNAQGANVKQWGSFY